MKRPKPLKRFIPIKHVDDLVVSSSQAKHAVAPRPKTPKPKGKSWG